MEILTQKFDLLGLTVAEVPMRCPSYHTSEAIEFHIKEAERVVELFGTDCFYGPDGDPEFWYDFVLEQIRCLGSIVKFFDCKTPEQKVRWDAVRTKIHHLQKKLKVRKGILEGKLVRRINPRTGVPLA